MSAVAEREVAAAGWRRREVRLGPIALTLPATLGLLVSVLDPHGVVTGGGIGSADSLYWRRFEQAARRHIWSESHRGLPILRAEYGEDAGLVGAALHALERLEG